MVDAVSPGDLVAPLPRAASVSFMSAEDRSLLVADLERQGVLVVSIDGVSASARGRLNDVIDEAVEEALHARGAAGPGIGSTSDADAALSDQLFRARRIGATALALSLGSLSAACARATLEPEDSATLRFWCAATRERPVFLILDVEDRDLAAFGDPLPLWLLLSGEQSVRACATDLRCSEDPWPDTPAAHDSAETAPQAANPSPSTSTSVRRSEPPPAEIWRAWVHALSALRGPQPLATFEKLFAKAYMPLTNAILDGLDDARATAACEEFRRVFSKAYADAFPTFGVTGKRPRMVLDVPELAAKAARLHGARAIQLLLVDAMRYDVGTLVRDLLVRSMDGRATLTEELLLFSALPSTTTRQLDVLARGVEALRSPPPSEREMEPLRGRATEMIRRVRAGTRDLYKLDAIEVRLREAGAYEALPHTASHVADAIERHASALAPRTMLFVFGDHGFVADQDGGIREGGSTPEEVIVPAYAWLVGEVH
jgi:hypothetical protein